MFRKMISKTVIQLLFLPFILSCDSITSEDFHHKPNIDGNQIIEKSDNQVENEPEISVLTPINILDENQTIQNLKEIEISNHNDNYDIFISASNGKKLNFRSLNSCYGEGPSYSIIASIPQLKIIFLDKTNSCHKGETILMVSLKDGNYKELNAFDIFQASQFFVSPDQKWLILSSCDCSMGYSCNMEIISLTQTSNSLYNSVFFDENICICKPINWISNNEFQTKKAIKINDEECEYKNVTLKLINNQWGIFN